MNKTVKHSIVAVVAATLGLCASFAHAATNSIYALTSLDQPVQSSSGCVRTTSWTPAAAAQDKFGCQCDKDLIAKDICEPKAAKPAAPVKAKKAAEFGKKVTISADALFDFNKAKLRPEGKTKLDNVVAEANKLVLEVIIAVGHADRIGSAAYNQKLSEKRAAAVKDYLVAKGIPANRVYTEGKGSKQPVTKPGQCKGAKSAKVIACLQPDRRVDIELVGTQKK